MIPLSPRLLQAANEYDPELWKRARADVPVQLLVPDGGIEIVNKLNPDVREFMIDLISYFMEFADSMKKVFEEETAK